jgi:hypothetical protein
MRLEIADTPVSPRHLAAQYKAARQRLLTAAPKPKPATVGMRPLPDFIKPVEMVWSMRLNAGGGVLFRYGNLTEVINLTKISDAVCWHFGISRMGLISHRRTKELVKPRHIFTHLARKHTVRSLPEIGRWLDGRDHTTIMHSDRVVAENYERFRADVEAIERRLGLKP